MNTHRQDNNAQLAHITRVCDTRFHLLPLNTSKSARSIINRLPKLSTLLVAAVLDVYSNTWHTSMVNEAAGDLVTLASHFERPKNATLLSGRWSAKHTGYATRTNKTVSSLPDRLARDEHPLLQIEDFPRLASNICNLHSSTDDIPSGIFSTLTNLNTALRLRHEQSKLTQLYTASQQEDAYEDDRKHERFTHALGSCRDFVAATIEKSAGSKPKATTHVPHQSMDVLTLRFCIVYTKVPLCARPSSS